MQLVLDRWNTRRSTTVPRELIGGIAPTRTESINLRGVFSLPIEQYAEQKSPLNQCVVMLYHEISWENGGLPTGTFGTEIKGRPIWERLLKHYSGKTAKTSVPSMKRGRHMQMSLKGDLAPGDSVRAMEILAAADAGQFSNKK